MVFGWVWALRCGSCPNASGVAYRRVGLPGSGADDVVAQPQAAQERLGKPFRRGVFGERTARPLRCCRAAAGGSATASATARRGQATTSLRCSGCASSHSSGKPTAAGFSVVPTERGPPLSAVEPSPRLRALAIELRPTALDDFGLRRAPGGLPQRWIGREIRAVAHAGCGKPRSQPVARRCEAELRVRTTRNHHADHEPRGGRGLHCRARPCRREAALHGAVAAGRRRGLNAARVISRLGSDVTAIHSCGGRRAGCPAVGALAGEDGGIGLAVIGLVRPRRRPRRSRTHRAANPGRAGCRPAPSLRLRNGAHNLSMPRDIGELLPSLRPARRFAGRHDPCGACPCVRSPPSQRIEARIHRSSGTNRHPRTVSSAAAPVIARQTRRGLCVLPP